MLDKDLDLSNYLTQYKDPFPAMKVLLSYPLCNWVNEYFNYTRDFESGLYYISYCRSIIEANREQISPSEYAKWDRYLITLKLNMLDHLNLWEEYIEYYDSLIDSKPYISYLAVRYEIIKRKLNRKSMGKNTEHLKRHQAYMLNEEEMKARYDAIINKLNFLINR